MSKKRNLSPTASLASCLDFAARVLSSTATIREICTKPLLAPMVVEAHRFGQKVMKYVEPGTPAEARKLLTVLQGEQNEKLCRETSLAGLDVADLTWDFEGSVADTLEMEMKELSNRAAMNSTDTCVVFSTRSQSSGGGQAVIWFPHANNETIRDEDDRKERHILLYVCPGRVKVVKNVRDLIKKMYEELPTLHENGAVYNVWMVILGLKSNNQTVIEELVKPRGNDNNQCEIKSNLNSPSSPIDSTVATTCDTKQVHATIASAELRNARDHDNQVTVSDFRESSNDRIDATTDPQNGESKSNELSPVSPRCSVWLNVTDPKDRSIFSFGLPQKTSTELQSKVSEPVTDSGDVPEKDKSIESSVKSDVNMEEHSIATNAQDEVTLPQNNQQQVLQPKRAVISTSLSDFSTVGKQRNFETEAGLGLGIPLQQGLAWRSCDGKVLRRSVRSLHTTMRPESSLRENIHTGHSEDCGIKQDTTGIERDDEVLDELHVDDNNNNCESVNEMLDCDSGEIRPPEVKIPAYEGQSELCQTTENEVDDNSPLSLRIGHESKVDFAGLTASLSESEKFPPAQKLKHAAVNYKDKLGTRVWWELEYIARKLEREEIIERQHQQPWQWQVDIQVKQGQRLTTRQFADSRKMVQTGRSRNDRVMKRNEAPTLAGQHVSGDQQNSSEVIVPAVVEPAQSQEYNHDVLPPAKATTIDAAQLNDHHSAGSAQVAVPQINTLPLSKYQEGSTTNLEGTKQMEVFQLLSESARSEKQHIRVSDEQEVNQDTKECSKPAILPVGSPLALDKSHERRQSSRTSRSQSAERESVNSRPLNFMWDKTSNVNNEEEDEDDTMAQAMWGNSHTSYERERNTNIQASLTKDEVQTTEVSAVPFNIRGRVPMRSQRFSDRITTATEAPSTSSDIANSPIMHSSLHSHSSIQSEETKPSLQKPSELHRTSTILQATPTQPPVATFIALHDNNSSDHTITSVKTRQERLNELRQKKLKKLQQTRDMSLLQQKEKQDQRNRPLSFANSVYSKASNRQLMQNALEFTLLAGGSMERERTLALQALAESTCDNFIVLLKSAKELQFRALYENHVERDTATRIFSVLPSNSSRAPLKLSNSEMISQFFKYSSAKKQFLPVPTRSFTVKTDACALVDQLVFKGKSKNNTTALARLL